LFIKTIGIYYAVNQQKSLVRVPIHSITTRSLAFPQQSSSIVRHPVGILYFLRLSLTAVVTFNTLPPPFAICFEFGINFSHGTWEIEMLP